MTDVIRRKIDRARLPQADGAPGADRGWRLALARATRDAAGLDLEVRGLSIRRLSLAEVLEIAPDHALVALLDGPEAGLGVVLLAPAVTSALIEMLTLGRLTQQPPAARKPTRIDAAMTAGMIDRALSGLEEALAEEADLIWAGGFRYASFLEDVRPLALLLEEEVYRVLSADVLLGSQRAGQVILILPANGRGRLPAVTVDPAQGDAPQFTHALSAQVMQVDCRLDAAIDRLRLPLHQVMALQVGQVLALPQAALDTVMLETTDGRRIARGRLGQHRGMRAVKLADDATRPELSRSPAPALVPLSEEETDLMPGLRAAG
jgi:flagellar motor switch protein FliM